MLIKILYFSLFSICIKSYCIDEEPVPIFKQPRIETLPPSPVTPVRPSANIARGRPTYQSSFYVNDYTDGSGSHAVDGILEPSFYDSPMFCVNDPAGGPNWLVVDLQSTYKISHVTVYNRLDCCSEREDYLIVGLLKKFTPGQEIKRGNYSLCGTYPELAKDKYILEIHCDQNAPASRYVVLQQPADGQGYLQFAEVEIYGTKIERIVSTYEQYPTIYEPQPDPAPRPAPAPIKTCPAGWDAFPQGDRCYKLITELKDWYEHSKTCYSFHPWSHLVMPHTPQNQKHADNYLNSKKDLLNQYCMNINPSYLKVWTSGIRDVPSNTYSPWVWRTFPSVSYPLGYTYWAGGEPNNAYNEESCIHFKLDGDTYPWNDVACATNNNMEHMAAFYDNSVVAMCALCEINFSE